MGKYAFSLNCYSLVEEWKVSKDSGNTFAASLLVNKQGSQVVLIRGKVRCD